MNDWPTRMRDMQRTGHAPAGPAPPLRLEWKVGLKGRRNYLWGSPIVKDGVVFYTLRTISNSKPLCLHAISIIEGSILWRNEEVRCDSTGSATYHQDSLFVCDAYGILSLDPSNRP